MATLADRLLEGSAVHIGNDIGEDRFSGSKVSNNRPTYHTGPNKPIRHQQIARILHHLSRDLKIAFPHLTIPSYDILNCLARNVCRNGNFQGGDWQAIIVEVLQIIRDRTDVGLDGHCHFTQLDDLTPLFPNSEMFDEWDAFRFAQALLHYLERELN